MSLSSSVARPLLAGMFIYGGLDSVRHAEGKVPAANKLVAPIGDASGGRIRTVHLVQVNGAAQVLAGAALATGRFARPAALVLAASLVPTTLAGHRFWEPETPAERHMQRIQFLKNMAMLGGLVLAAADPSGRAARRRARKATPAR
jgi:putative oxidoreductase